jgi:pyruvate-formate lyase-activating enzyme
VLQTADFCDLLAAVDAEVKIHRNLKRVLEALDESKRDMFQHFRQHLDSDAAAQAVTLKIQNLCLAKYHYLAQSATVLSRPFGLIVDPSNFCNLQCPGCVHSPTAKSEMNWETGNLGYDHFAAYMNRYGAYATHITMCSWGEPLLNKHTPAFLRLAKQYLIRTMLSTNLSIGRLDAEGYVASGLDFLVLSIDGATQPIYQQFRRNGNLDVVYRNIRNLVEAKQRLGKQTPILNWQFLAFEHNRHEIPLAIQTARELGVDMISVRDPFAVSWDVPSIRSAKVDGQTEVFNRDCDVGVHNNWNAFPGELAAGAIGREFASRWIDRLPADSVEEPAQASEHTCRWLYSNMTLDANRKISPCCGTPMRSYDLDFGRFDANGGEEVFNSEKYRFSRKYFSGLPQAPMLTQPHCVNCRWNQDNPNIGPAHVDQYLFDVPAIDPASRALLCG